MEALAGYLMRDNVQDSVLYFFLSCQIMVVSNGINSINASIFPAAFINFNFLFSSTPHNIVSFILSFIRAFKRPVSLSLSPPSQYFLVQ